MMDCHLLFVLLFTGVHLINGCLDTTQSDNTASIRSADYPSFQYQSNCQCAVEARNDFNVKLTVAMETEEAGQCDVQLTRHNDGRMLLFCPSSGSHTSSFYVFKGQIMTWALNNEMDKNVNLKIDITADDGAEYDIVCANGLPEAAVWVNYASSYTAGSSTGGRNDPITGAMIGVIVIILIVIIVLIIALIKMNIDKARVRRQKEREASVTNSQSNLASKPSLNPRGKDDGVLNAAYSTQSVVDPSTRGSTPVGFADLGGPTMRSSLPPSAKGSQVSVGSFMAGHPTYGSKTSLNNPAYRSEPERPENGRPAYQPYPYQAPPTMTNVQPNVAKPVPASTAPQQQNYQYAPRPVQPQPNPVQPRQPAPQSIPNSATPLTNIPRVTISTNPSTQPQYPPYNRGISQARSVDSDAESARYATAPTSPFESPTEFRNGNAAETTI